MAPPPPGEPRGLTPLDLMALLAGIAVGLILPSRSLGMPMFHIPAWVVAGVLGLWVIKVACLGVGFVVVARRARYGGLPRPAEWLAVLIGLTFVVEGVPNVDEAINATWAALGVGEMPVSALRWAWAAAALAVALAGLGAAVVGGDRLPAAVRSALLIVAALAWLWGPTTVLPQELPFHPFWSVTPPEPPADYRLFWAGVGLRKGIVGLPHALTFAVPTVATVMAARHRGAAVLTWPEWAGAGAAALIAFGGLALFGLNLFAGPHEIDRAIELLAWPVAFGLAVMLVRRLGSTWNRAVGSGYDRHQSTPATPEG